MKNQNIVFTRSVPKMSKARLFRSILALGVVALIMHVSLPRAQAYDLSSLNGSYADFNSGLAPVSPGGPHRPVPISGYLPFYSEAVRDQPSRFTVWRLIVSPASARTGPGVLAIVRSMVARLIDRNNALSVESKSILCHFLLFETLFMTSPPSAVSPLQRFNG